MYSSSAVGHDELHDDNSDLSEEGRRLIENDYEPKQDNLPPLTTGISVTTTAVLPETRAGWTFSNIEEVCLISCHSNRIFFSSLSIILLDGVNCVTSSEFLSWVSFSLKVFNLTIFLGLLQPFILLVHVLIFL